MHNYVSRGGQSPSLYKEELGTTSDWGKGYSVILHIVTYNILENSLLNSFTVYKDK